MFCTDCGKQLEDGAKFCIYCGAVQDGAGNAGAVPAMDQDPLASRMDQPLPDPMGGDFGGQAGTPLAQQDQPATTGGLVMFIMSVVLGGLSIGTVFLDWIAVETPSFFGISFEKQCSLWELASMMMTLHEDNPDDGFIVLAVIIAIPLLIMAAGALLWLVGGVAWLITKTARKAWGWFLASSFFLALSNIVFLIMLYATRMLIDAAVDEVAEGNFGIHFKTSEVLELKPAIWPWIMLVMVIAMLILLICSKKGLGKKAKQGAYPAAAPIPVSPYIPEQPDHYGPAQPDPFAPSGMPIPPMNPINPVEGMAMGEDDGLTQMLGDDADTVFVGGGLYSAPGLVMFQDKFDSSQIYGCSLEAPVVMGRDPEGCNIVISSDKSISRKHCRLYRNNNICYVEDLNSFNHTYINDRMLTSPSPLQRGDTLKLGTVELLVTECDMNKG